MFCFQLVAVTYGQQAAFIDVAEENGINFTSNGCVLASGLSFIDFNNDDLDDIFMSSCHGQNIQWYQNTGAGFIEMTPSFLSSDTNATRMVLWADYDNDGDKDLFIGNSDARNKLYRNNGDGSFEDITDFAGLSTLAHASYAAAWADYNKDGLLDLYVANRSTQAVPMQNKLYRNNGDGTLTDVTLQAGVGNVNGATIATAWIDYNNDGWPDIFNANDRGTINRLYRNNGNGTFTNVSNANVNLVMDAMSVTVADIDNNHFLDIYITNDATGNKLMMNNGDGTFNEMASQMGVQVNKGTWGSLFTDFDHDGDFDLFVAAMSSGSGPNGVSNDFFENQNGTFVNVTGSIMPIDSFPSMGAAMADYNQDGFYDLAILNANTSRSILLQNTGNSNNWIKVKPEGVYSNRDAVGSWIHVWCNGQNFSRYTQCGANFASQSADYEIIGIGSYYYIDSVVVYFPLGIKRVISNPAINSTLMVPEVEFVVSHNQVADTNFNIGPNPFAGFIQIMLNQVSANSIQQVQLLSATGQEIPLQSFDELDRILLIPGQTLSTGMYVLNLFTDFGQSAYRLIYSGQ
jgi:hypothetical protein